MKDSKKLFRSSTVEPTTDNRQIPVQFWTERPTKLKDQIILLKSYGISHNQISKILNCAKSTVSYHCKRANIKPNTVPKLSDGIDDNVKEIIKYLWGVLAIRGPEISDVLGVDVNIINSCTRGLSFPQHSDWSSYDRVKFRRKKLKLLGVIYLGGKCVNCGYVGNLSDYDFHHKYKEDKEFQISGKSISWSRVKKELEKCELLCSHCHRNTHTTNDYEKFDTFLNHYHNDWT